IICTGVVGICILWGGLAHRQQTFRVEGGRAGEPPAQQHESGDWLRARRHWSDRSRRRAGVDGFRLALGPGSGAQVVRFTIMTWIWMMGAMLSYSKACFGVPKHGTLFLF